jgi:uncharacterized protein YkwD
VKPIQGFPVAFLAVLLAGCAMEPARPAAGPDPALGRVMSPDNFDRALLARAIFEETNRVREANGSAPLAHLAALDEAADEQASYLALSLTVGHTNPIPGEKTTGERVARQGLEAASLGENAIMMPALGPAEAPVRDYTYAAYAAYLLQGWMNSPPHRETLLNLKFTHLGCAARAAHGFGQGDRRIFAVQVFFRPADKELVSPDPARR